MTRYILTAAPLAGPFRSATEAVCYALSRGISPNWKAVSA